jgi:hypothetical protein
MCSHSRTGDETAEKIIRNSKVRNFHYNTAADFYQYCRLFYTVIFVLQSFGSGGRGRPRVKQNRNYQFLFFTNTLNLHQLLAYNYTH